MVSEIIANILRERGKTKQWLAGELNLSYSTLHQKLSNNTFTAQEFIQLCQIFNLSLEHFVENKNEQGQIKMKSIPIDNRPDVPFEEFTNYERMGLVLEKQHSNGMEIYTPYGVHVTIQGNYAYYQAYFQQMFQQIDTKMIELKESDQNEDIVYLEIQKEKFQVLEQFIKSFIETGNEE